MTRFMIKASEYKNVCKAVNDRKLAELKKEIIEILKKQDEKEVKKAIDYFNSQELHYTHLEKSLNGKWIEKAGYGIGTVRIWKGKKYKKIAPGKWARVFEKEGRGTNIAIGKLIARVQKIDNVEDLMAFVMANKQRFVDENGVDLPVLDKLRAAVDARNGNVGNKGTSKIENTTLKYDDNGSIKEVESTLIEPSKTARNFKYNKDKLSIDELKDAKNEIDSYIQKLNKEISSLEKIKKENADKLTDNAKANIDGNIAYSKNIINAYTKDKEDCEKLLEEKNNKPAEKKTVAGVKILSKNEIHNLTKGEVQDYRKELHDAMKKLDYGDSDFDILHETKKIADDTWNNKEYKGAVDSDKNIKDFENFLKENNLHQHDKIEYKGKEYVIDYDSQDGDKDLLWIPPVFDDPEFDVKEIKLKTNEESDSIATSLDELTNAKGGTKVIGGVKVSYNPPNGYRVTHKAPSGTEITTGYDTIEETHQAIKNKINRIKNGEIPAIAESDAEKHQNRSDAMKGNKNAYKGGHEDEPVHNKVAKNGVYYTFDGFSHGLNRSFRQAKDLPQNIKDNINNSVNRYLDYVDNWADKGYKKVADDMIKNPEKYQHMSLEEFNKETGYDKSDVSEILSIKTKIEFAEKLRNFNLDETMISKDAEQNFSRDEIYPVSLKQNIEEGFLPDQIADIEREKAEKAEKKEKVAKKPSGKLPTTNPEKLKPIATNTKVEDGKVKMPYSKELSDEIKQLVGTTDSKKKNPNPREFFTKVYYDNGNLIATDSHALKIVKVGELDGIENGSYVDIENTKDGVTLTRDKDFSEKYKFANYSRIIPDNNKEKIVLDNKALLSKVKELKKDGSISGKDSYVTFDIKGNDLMLDGVKVGDVSAANFEGEGSDYFNMDVNLLTPYLSGDTTDLISSTDNEKAMYIGNDSAINIIMPQNKWDKKVDSNGNWIKEERRKNYNDKRASKAYEDEAKANQKAAKKQSNQEYVDYMIDRVKESVNKPDFAERMIAKLPDWTTEQLQRLHKQAMADVDHLMETKDFNANSFMTFTDKNFGVMPRVFIGQNYAMKQHPEIVKEVERLLEERGEKIEKSLFDDFIVDVFAADDEEENEDELYEGETEYNNYSAEQPELFNSTSMKVCEALDRIKNQVL